MKRAKRYLIPLIFVVLLYSVAGCVGTKEYPYRDSLDTSIKDIEESIVGDYECGAVYVFADPKKINNCNTLRIRQIKPGMLEVNYLNKLGKVLFTKVVTEGSDYSKSNPWLVFPWADGVAGKGAIGGGMGTNSFTLTTSSDLIIKRSGGGAVVVVVLPIAGYATSWDIIKRKDKQEELIFFGGRVPQPPEPVTQPPVEW